MTKRLSKKIRLYPDETVGMLLRLCGSARNASVSTKNARSANRVDRRLLRKGKTISPWVIWLRRNGHMLCWPR